MWKLNGKAKVKDTNLLLIIIIIITRIDNIFDCYNYVITAR